MLYNYKPAADQRDWTHYHVSGVIDTKAAVVKELTLINPTLISSVIFGVCGHQGKVRWRLLSVVRFRIYLTGTCGEDKFALQVRIKGWSLHAEPAQQIWGENQCRKITATGLKDDEINITQFNLFLCFVPAFLMLLCNISVQSVIGCALHENCSSVRSACLSIASFPSTLTHDCAVRLLSKLNI